jgi:hypothetical protein
MRSRTAIEGTLVTETEPFRGERFHPMHERKIKRHRGQGLAGGQFEFFAFFWLKNASHGV